MEAGHLVIPNIRRRHHHSYLDEIRLAAPKLISRNFHVEKPNGKDILEFRLLVEKGYLSPIIGCFDGMEVT